jgi:pSer/pThr/pTyr-binding forkhead associated (FHA) protein
LPHEDSKGQNATVLVNDVPWFAAREVSRVHASVLHDDDAGGDGFVLRDESSTTGTYVNGHRVGLDDPRSPPNPIRLQPLDVVWLGPSGVNSYVWLVVN